jgi:dTDP-4-amino-4,6-dideoxygalactose transaminase
MSRKEFLSYSPPALSSAEIDAVVEVLKRGDWLSSGPKTKEFEALFKEKFHSPAALALNSCTAGLHLAMLVHRVGPEDEVITTPMTFCATANVIEHVGGKVRFADVDPETLVIDPSEIEKHITKKTKVLMPVHYGGHPADMPKINAMAKSIGAFVVEDAAHAIPSRVGHDWVGSSDNLTVFSFYATKNITSGEGGMITGRTDWVDTARRLALHGMTKNAWDRFAKGGTWKYDVPEPGFKYNLPDMASALGLAQLKRLDELYSRREHILSMYQKAFRGHKVVSLLKVKPGYQSSHHLFVILLNLETLSIDRDRFIHELTERNIGTGVHYMPVHMMSYYAKKYDLKPQDFPVSLHAFERMVSLPLNSKMTDADAYDVIEAVNDICAKFAR